MSKYPTLKIDSTSNTAHFRCGYCGKTFPSQDKFTATVFGAQSQFLTREKMEFCCKQHAMYEQFSREGKAAVGVLLYIVFWVAVAWILIRSWMQI